MRYRITAELARNGNAETYDNAVSHWFFNDQQLYLPGPNLNWRFRMRWTSSMPESVTAAVR